VKISCKLILIWVNYERKKGVLFMKTVYSRCAGYCIHVESRGIGSAVTLRPNKDSARNAIVIGDPTNSVLADGVLSGWQIYAKIVSIEHSVFLQVWRPSPASTSYLSLFGGDYIKMSL